jgi:hypothetical protein
MTLETGKGQLSGGCLVSKGVECRIAELLRFRRSGRPASAICAMKWDLGIKWA